MDTIYERMDWQLLARQKEHLCQIIYNNTKPNTELLEGLLTMIDNIQDECYDIGFPVVYTIEKEEEEDLTLHAGDRVRCISVYGSPYPTLDKDGTVIGTDTEGNIVVNFDNDVDGWEDQSNGIVNGHGLFVEAERLRKINK